MQAWHTVSKGKEPISVAECSVFLAANCMLAALASQQGINDANLERVRILSGSIRPIEAVEHGIE